MAKNNRKYPERRHIDTREADSYDYHKPVFLEKCIEFLNIREDGFYADGTLGGGGHSAEILKRLGPDGRLFAFDKDLTAINYCREKFTGELDKGESSRIILLNESFGGACNIKKEKKIDGLLLDLGVSSRQLDDSSRGFSYRFDSPLNLRFASNGMTAEELLNTADEVKIANILRSYGEEPFAEKIARRIVEMRRAFPLHSTIDLKNAVADSVPASLLFKSLSRTFQAVRIAVNDELEVLQYTLANIMPKMAQGARIVVISYHSLEDRIVKDCFREFSKKKFSDDPIPQLLRAPIIKILTPKPIEPDEDYIRHNPRSRSAKLRVAEIL